MNTKLKDMNVDYLFKAILSLETMDECYNFVAKTGASTATISRVNRSLNYGSDGYKVVFERVKD